MMQRNVSTKGTCLPEYQVIRVGQGLEVSGECDHEAGGLPIAGSEHGVCTGSHEGRIGAYIDVRNDWRNTIFEDLSLRSRHGQTVCAHGAAVFDCHFSGGCLMLSTESPWGDTSI